MRRRALWAAAIGLLCAGPASAAPARVLSVIGTDVDVKSSPAEPAHAAKQGEALDAGASIETGPTSSCVIALGEDAKSAVKLFPNASVRLASLEPVRVDLSEGKLIAVVRGLSRGASFQVGTPAAVATARGTVFTASPDAFEAIEDRIVLQNASGGPETVLEEGQEAAVENDSFRVGGIPEKVIIDVREEAADVADLLDASAPAESATPTPDLDAGTDALIPRDEAAVDEGTDARLDQETPRDPAEAPAADAAPNGS